MDIVGVGFAPVALATDGVLLITDAVIPVDCAQHPATSMPIAQSQAIPPPFFIPTLLISAFTSGNYYTPVSSHRVGGRFSPRVHRPGTDGALAHTLVGDKSRYRSKSLMSDIAFR
jgi:hypothetical protein